jgi:hypothetical protein
MATPAKNNLSIKSLSLIEHMVREDAKVYTQLCVKVSDILFIYKQNRQILVKHSNIKFLGELFSGFLIMWADMVSK